MQWTIADSLGFIPKDDPETYQHNFSATEGMAAPLWCPQMYIMDGNLEDIRPITDFSCTRRH